nr:MAG TPA: hypothetical protein [Caudoviricetes sp.]
MLISYPKSNNHLIISYLTAHHMVLFRLLNKYLIIN